MSNNGSLQRMMGYCLGITASPGVNRLKTKQRYKFLLNFYRCCMMCTPILTPGICLKSFPKLSEFVIFTMTKVSTICYPYIVV